MQMESIQSSSTIHIIMLEIPTLFCLIFTNINGLGVQAVIQYSSRVNFYCHKITIARCVQVVGHAWTWS